MKIVLIPTLLVYCWCVISGLRDDEFPIWFDFLLALLPALLVFVPLATIGMLLDFAKR